MAEVAVGGQRRWAIGGVGGDGRRAAAAAVLTEPGMAMRHPPAPVTDRGHSGRSSRSVTAASVSGTVDDSGRHGRGAAGRAKTNLQPLIYTRSQFGRKVGISTLHDFRTPFITGRSSLQRVAPTRGFG